jgi:hypothetical protein
MFKILLHAVHWEHLFSEGFPGKNFCAFGYSPSIAVLGINLSNPTGITVTGCSDEDLRMKIPEMERFQMGLGELDHGFSLDEKKKLPNFGTRVGIQIIRSY